MIKSFSNSIKSLLNNPKKSRKWGQILLVFAVVLNGVVLWVNLHLNNLQGELQDKRYEENYFIINEKTKRSESAKYTLLNANSNQLVILRRLAEDHLSSEEDETIRGVIKELNYQSNRSKVGVVALAFLLANDPPEGTNPFEMFILKSDSELVRLQKKYEIQAGDYALELKSEMVQLMDDISYWEIGNAVSLVMSNIILILGSILIFASNRIDTVE